MLIEFQRLLREVEQHVYGRFRHVTYLIFYLNDSESVLDIHLTRKPFFNLEISTSRDLEFVGVACVFALIPES